jgi:hypothetical protein
LPKDKEVWKILDQINRTLFCLGLVVLPFRQFEYPPPLEFGKTAVLISMGIAPGLKFALILGCAEKPLVIGVEKAFLK